VGRPAGYGAASLAVAELRYYPAMEVSEVIAAVDRLAPFALAEPWDHVGLQVGSRHAAVRRVLVALEADDRALDEARVLGCDFLLVHHPLLFDPVDRLNDETAAGRVALRAACHGVAVLVAHTNLDKARGGLADVAADMLGLEAAAPLTPAAAGVMKLVGFVPRDDLAVVRAAVFAAGAGVIGEYEHCSWSVEGRGTFLGREGTSPAVGEPGRDEEVDEVRFEAVFPRQLRRAVVEAYVSAHPYEEPAFDLVPLENEVASVGLGRLGRLPEARPLAGFASDVAAALRLPAVRFAGDPDQLVRTVAVLPGAGADAIRLGVGRVADVLVTGDVRYHEARAAASGCLALVEAPHGVLEQEALLRWAPRLAEALAPHVHVDTFRDPDVALWRTAAAEPAVARPPAGAVVSASRHDLRYRLYADGGARGNPGPAGIGVRLLSPEDEVVEELADFIGTATNNVAEYEALLAGLELALDRGVQRLDVFLDSELVVRQLNGDYRVRDAGLKPLWERARELLDRFHEVEVHHVPRAQNRAADALVNRAIDEATR